MKYAIHPVAGRMPGHMNVLLAEANVPYDKLKDMEEINGEFARGRRRPGDRRQRRRQPGRQQRSGEPDLRHADPRTPTRPTRIIVLKRSMNPGFAGIENELFYDAKTSMLFGDAKQTLTRLVSEVKNV